MKEILNDFPHVTGYAEEAMKNVGVDPYFDLIRGGTDGSRLSFMGMPCPNLFTGEMAIHSKHEYVVVQDMHKSVKTLIELIQIWEKNMSHKLIIKEIKSKKISTRVLLTWRRAIFYRCHL